MTVDRIRLITVIVVAVFGFAAAFGGSYGLALLALSRSQQAMCPILELITKDPVPPPKNPNQKLLARQYQFYVNAKTLEHRYGCR